MNTKDSHAQTNADDLRTRFFQLIDSIPSAPKSDIGTAYRNLYVRSAEDSVYRAVINVAESMDEYEALVARYPEYLRAAHEHARLGFPGRFLVTAAVSDRPGIMFEFARALAYATCNLEDIRSVVAAGQVLILAIAAQTKPEPRLTGVLLRDKLHEAPFCREKDGTVHVVARVAEATTAIGVNILSVFGEERQDHYELRLFVFLASDGVEKELRDRLEAVCGLLRRIRGSVTHV